MLYLPYVTVAELVVVWEVEVSYDLVAVAQIVSERGVVGYSGE